jgi:hypothetical protein
MKISQCILKLQEQLQQLGDVEVVVWTGGENDPYETSADFLTAENENGQPRLMVVEGPHSKE